MKVKLQRQTHHRTTNTHTFKGFGEKVRALNVRTLNVRSLNVRTHEEVGPTLSNLYQTLIHCRELNLTQEFQDFQCDLKGDLQTTAQVVVQESNVAKCLATHLRRVDLLSLQPLLDLLVAFAKDLPKEFYQRHFYTFLEVLVSRLKAKEPEEIQAVFLCLVSLFKEQRTYLRDDLYRLYHTEGYAALLSSTWPWYINELAAQTFAFLLHLLRNISNKAAFWGMAFRKLRVDAGQAQGLGRFLAAMMKSDVIQRLHSTTRDTLTHILKLLGEEDVPGEQAVQSVTYAVTQVAHHITAKHPDNSVAWQTSWKEDYLLVWPVFWETVDLLLPDVSSEASSRHLHAVLQVVQVLVGYKQSVLVTDVSDTLTHCLAVLQTQGLSEEIGHTVFDMVANLLTTPHHHTTTATLNRAVSALLTSHYTHRVKFGFIKQLFDLPRFDTEILPRLLQYLSTMVEAEHSDDAGWEVLEVLTTLVLQKQPLCKTGMDMESWKCYPLNFSRILARKGSNGGIPKLMERKLSAGLEEDLSNVEELVLCLLCLPHVAPLDYQDLAPYLAWIISVAAEALNDQTERFVDDDTTVIGKKKAKAEPKSGDLNIDLNVRQNISTETKRSLFLLGVLIEVMSHILSGEDFLASLSKLQLLEVLKQKPQYRESVHFLRALNFHFTIAAAEGDSSIISQDFLREFYPLVAPCLASADPQVRLLVIHTLSLFPVTLPPPPEKAGPTESIFQVMVRAECVAVTPGEYKERLRYLAMLDADHVDRHQPVCGTYRLAPLLLFLGQLYINYKDMWIPVLKAIATYAHTLPDKTFWPLWFSRLKIASHITKQTLNGKMVDSEDELFPSNEIVSNVILCLTTHDGFSRLPHKPDHLNYRELLWKTMEKFPSVCEARNRDLVPLFFEFLEQELFPIDFTIAPTQNLKFTKSANTTVSKEDDIPPNGQMDNVQTSVESASGKHGGGTTSDAAIEEEDKAGRPHPRRAPIKSLCAQLAVFAKFHNPRMLYKTKKLQKMYQELLSHPSPVLQRLSLDCIMTYNFPHLAPYRENLYKILDDKSFKNALTLFSIDGSEQLVEEDHREGLMPYLMRILYGKMHFKTGANSSGKSKITVRKATVLRFLAGARESELDTFLDLSFDVLIEHLEGSALEMVVRARENLDLQKVVPLSRLQGALTTLENIIEKIGNLLSNKIPYLLKIILYVLNLVTMLLEERETISHRNVSFLKHLRQQAQKLLLAFFRQFGEYSWSLAELDAVFEAMVWPNLRRLPDEGLATPLPLLNLLYLWSGSPRYVPLLARCHPGDAALTPLPYVVKLLSHEKCSDVVSSLVLSLVENLLTSEDFQPEEDGAETTLTPLPESPNMVEVCRQLSRDGQREQTYGTGLLTPHLDTLLGSMKYLLSKLGKGKPVASRDLTILTSLTEWVSSRDISGDLVSLIIPLVVKKHVKKEERMTQLLTICVHLLPVVENSAQYLRPLLSQFSSLGGRHTREALCLSVSAIANCNEQYKLLADTASELNAWNPKMVEEVDFERRIRCYETLTDYFSSQESIDVNMCHLVMYNCVFFVCNAEDSSLRDLSTQCLTQMIDFCACLQIKQPAEFKQVISDKFLPQILPLLKNDNEVVRVEALSILRHAILKYHRVIDKLADLYQLVDEVDDDSDFFLNSMHIQRHRRARALSKLSDKLTSGEMTFTMDTLSEYLMPLATVYLMKDAYAKSDYLITSCIACLGAIAKQLPWHPYQRLLRTHLSIVMKEDLKHLRQGVRLLDAVLEAFHEEVQVYDDLRQKATCREGGSMQEKDEGEAMEEGVEKKTGKMQKGKETDQQKMGKEKDSAEQEEELEEENKQLGGEGKEVMLSQGQKVYRTLVNTIIPQIQKTLAAPTKAETEHKVNKSKYPEDEDIKRIPLAFALVKLMKKLPKKVLDTNLNNVLMKIITFLKSKAESIREESREMLVKIMLELGGSYLKWLVNDLQSILTQGFQSHVLVYTLHSVLLRLRPHLTPDHVDACMSQMIEICKQDILGLQAEEKGVSQITSKVKEARRDKGYDILCFTAEFISTESLKELIIPLKDVLADTQDKKVVNKMARCLKEVANGLDRNTNIPIVQKSIFIYGMLNERLTELTTDKKAKNPSVKKSLRTDSFLLVPEPKRTKINPKTSLKATSHVLMEFSLRHLCNLMRRDRFSPKEAEHVSLLDPFISVAGRCINSEHPEVSMEALKCINCLIKFPLPSLTTELGKISSQLFVILSKFSTPELARGKIYDLVQMSFKTLAAVIKTVDHYMMSEEDVRVLLEYVERNLDDIQQQQTAFVVLQAVISRKIDALELHKVMKQVKGMSVTCARFFALQQARVTYYTYLLTYPMRPRQISNHICYFLGNISYPVEEGRFSAITIINAIIANFPTKVFSKDLETNLWFKISEQLVIEDSKENRVLLHKALKVLFQRSSRKEMLVELCCKLLEEEDKKPDFVAYQLASRAICAFLDAPVKLLPLSLLSTVAPAVISLINPAKYSSQLDSVTGVDSDLEVRQMDTALTCLLEVLTKSVDAFFSHADWSQHISDDIWGNVQAQLRYPHIQVRVTAANLVGKLLAAFPIENSASPKFAEDTDCARSLVLDLCDLLRTQAPSDTALLTQLSLSVIRNLIYLVRHAAKVPLRKPKGQLDSDKKSEAKTGENDESRGVKRKGTNEEDNVDENELEEAKDESEGNVAIVEKNRNNDASGSRGARKRRLLSSNTGIEQTKKNQPAESQEAASDTSTVDPTISSATWVLHRVGNLAYEELQAHGKEQTVVRAALLNLIAGLTVVVKDGIKSPHILGYLIKHLARELSDENLPKDLADRTKEVANLIKESVGLETYTRRLTSAQTMLSKKRLQRRAKEHQQKTVNPVLAQHKKRKKQEALKESRKRRMAERKGTSVTQKKPRLRDYLIAAE